jgi:hypothetical protein
MAQIKIDVNDLADPAKRPTVLGALAGLPEWSALKDADGSIWFKLPVDFPKKDLPESAREGMLLGTLEEDGGELVAAVESEDATDWDFLGELTVEGRIASEEERDQFDLEAPTGDGCIEGMRCPKCGNHEEFKIVGSTLWDVLEDGCDDHDDVEWDDDSYCRCSECGHDGTVRDFTPGSDPNPARWNEDGIQFARLLAEIRAVGLTKEQYEALSESMDLARNEIDEVLERAETEFQKIKESL